MLSFKTQTLFFILSLLLLLPSHLFSQCSENQVEIKVTVLTDLNGDENTWTLSDAEGNVLTGGPYEAGKVNADIQKVCVQEGTVLTFSFRDGGANGIGDGYFMVESCGNILAYHTGYMSSFEKATVRAQACQLSENDQAEVYTRLKRVILNDDIRWKITGSGGNPVYGSGVMENEINYDFIRTVVPEGEELEFRILNLNGGGFSSSGNQIGHYEFGYNCVKIAEGGKDFDILKIIPFKAPFSESGQYFEHIIGEYDYDRAEEVKELCEGGYIIAGTSGPENIEPRNQAALIKVSPDGDVVWFRKYGDSDSESASDVVQTSTGGFAVCGAQTLPGSNDVNVYLFRTDHDGNLLWEKNIGGPGYDIAKSLIETSDGGFLIAGESNDPNGAGNSDGYIVKTSASGEIIWKKYYGNEFRNSFTSVAELPDGDFMAAGTSAASNNMPWNDDETDAWIIRIHRDGSLVYEKTFGGTKGDAFYDLKIPGKEYALAGGYSKSDKTQAFLLKLNVNTGKGVWEKRFGDDGTEIISSVDVNSAGEIFTGGTFGSYYTNSQKGFITTLKATGVIIETKQINHPGVNLLLKSGIVTSSDDFFVCGNTFYKTFPDNRPDIFFMKAGRNLSLVSKPVISGDSIFCEGDSVVLKSSLAEVETGATYSWSDGSKGWMTTVKEPGYYTVTVSDFYGNEAVSDTFKVTMIPAPEVELVASGEPNICFGTSLDIKAQINNPSSGNSFSYLWNTGETDSLITTSNEGKYFVEVSNEEYGCHTVSAPFKVNVQKPYNDEEICMVTVDPETQKNMIVFTKTPGKRTKAHIIWKETSVAYVYEPVGAVDFNGPNYYIDHGSVPGVQAERYRVSVLDMCDNQSLKSAPHKTIHLTINEAGGGQEGNNLIWDHYEGFRFGTYTIYRGTEPGKLDSIHSIQSSLTSWSDVNPPEGLLYYQIGVRKEEPCDLLSSKKTSGGPLKTSLSNLEDNKMRASGINDDSSAGKILIYPNPYSERVNIVYSIKKPEMVSISVFNSLGQKVGDLYSGYQEPADYKVEFSGRDYGSGPGVYMIRIQIGKEIINKMVIEK